MAWHASIAVGEGVRSAAQHPFGVIPKRGPRRDAAGRRVKRKYGVRNKSDKMIGMRNKRPGSKNGRLKFPFLFKMSLYY